MKADKNQSFPLVTHCISTWCAVGAWTFTFSDIAFLRFWHLQTHIVTEAIFCFCFSFARQHCKKSVRELWEWNKNVGGGRLLIIDVYCCRLQKCSLLKVGCKKFQISLENAEDIFIGCIWWKEKMHKYILILAREISSVSYSLLKFSNESLRVEKSHPFQSWSYFVVSDTGKCSLQVAEMYRSQEQVKNTMSAATEEDDEDYWIEILLLCDLF